MGGQGRTKRERILDMKRLPLSSFYVDPHMGIHPCESVRSTMTFTSELDINSITTDAERLERVANREMNRDLNWRHAATFVTEM